MRLSISPSVRLLRQATRFNKVWIALAWLIALAQAVIFAFGPSWETADALVGSFTIAALVTGLVYYQTKATLREFATYMLMAALDDDVAHDAAQQVITNPDAVYERLAAKADATRRVSAEDLIVEGDEHA